MLQRPGHRSLQLMGQSGDAFVCTRLPHILQCVRRDNARKDGGLWLCKAQIMLYVSLGWSSVFIVDLNVSSVWATAEVLLHQSRLASLGRTYSIVSPLEMIMDWLACVTTIKLSVHSAVQRFPPPSNNSCTSSYFVQPRRYEASFFSFSPSSCFACWAQREAALIHNWAPGGETRVLFVLL